jgi:hypothetical protein
MNKLQYLETLKNSKIMILPPIIKKNALGALSVWELLISSVVMIFYIGLFLYLAYKLFEVGLCSIYE